MKRLLPAFLLLWAFVANAQMYHEGEKESLRNVLRQEGAHWIESEVGTIPYNAKNFELIGLSEADTLNWYNSEAWVENIEGLTWNEATPKRVVKLHCLNVVDRTIYDLKNFSELDSIECAVRKYGIFSKYISFNLPDQSKLSYISGIRMLFLNNSLDKQVNIEYLYLAENGFVEDAIKKMTKLKDIHLFDVVLRGPLDFSNNVLLEKCTISQEIPGSLDFTKNKNLKNLYISTTNGGGMLTSLDLSNNVNLETLTLSTLVRLKQLSLPKGENRLNNVVLAYLLGLENVDFGDVNPEYLDFNTNESIKFVDLSKMTNLKKLDFTENRLVETLDLSKNINLEYIDCSKNALSSINLLNNKKLGTLICEDNNFRFSTLPLMSLKTYIYRNQKNINGGSVMVSDGIDLSSEYIINGYQTTFQWFDGDELLDLKGANGKFTLTDDLVGKNLVCKMTNACFPLLKIDYNVNVQESLTTGIKENVDEGKSDKFRLESNVLSVGAPIVILNSDNKTGVAHLYSTAGQLIATATIDGNRTEINASLSPNVYILKVKTLQNEKACFKVVVK